MKKKIAVVLALCFMLSASLFIAACGDTEKDRDVHTHTMTHTENSPATCTEKGNREYWSCTECGKYFEDAAGSKEAAGKASFDIEPLGHTFSDKWSSNSEKHYHAATCGHDEIKDASEHEFKDGVCGICGEKEATKGLAITEHEDGYCYVSGIGAAADKEIIIPSSYNGKPVKRISDRAFEGSDIVSVVIPGSVERLFSYAFRDCGSLVSVEIPSSVTGAGDGIFDGCRSLTEIVIPDSVEELGYDTFDDCYALTIYAEHKSEPSGWKGWNRYGCPVVWNCKNNSVADDGFEYAMIGGVRYGFKDGAATLACQPSGKGGKFTVPASVEYKNKTYPVKAIGKNAFMLRSYGENALTEIEIPNSVTAIGEGAFFGCGELAQISIPSSVTSIGSGAFGGCTSLSRVELSDNVTSLGEGVFNVCESLESVVLPSGLKTIPKRTFYGCEKLRDMFLPSGATGIGEAAYTGCVSLGELTFPAGLTTIGDLAFSGCENLEKVTLRSGITKVGRSVFYDCEAAVVYCEAAAKPSGWSNDWIESQPVVWNCKNNDTASDGFVYAKIGGVRYKLGEEKASVPVQPKNISGIVTVQNSVTYKDATYTVTELEENAFHGCNLVTAVKLPSSLNKLGGYSIAYCALLEKVEFEGTRAQWDAIEKPQWWSGGKDIPVVCSDETV